MKAFFLALAAAILPTNTSADVNIVQTPSGTYAVALTAKPADEFMANWDGPWKVDVTDQSNLKVKTSDLKKDLPGFVLDIQAEPNAAFDYKLTAYFCRLDKSECVRKVLQGKVQVRN